MILCTFPGKFGDLLWALPTIRAISRRVGEPVALQIPGALGSIGELLRKQPYIGRLTVNHTWEVQNTAPATPRTPEYLAGSMKDVFHLGYRDWPKRALPFETLDCLNDQWSGVLFEDGDLDLGTPWITTSERFSYSWSMVYGFTDEHFELKYGLTQLLERKPQSWRIPGTLPPTVIGENPRWQAEGGYDGTSWEEAAAFLHHSYAFLGCNSGLHVLAVAMGIPVVMMEPSEARWNPIFYPLGTEGPQVQLVRGIDGNPTFDARHVRDTLEKALAAQQAKGVDSPTP